MAKGVLDDETGAGVFSGHITGALDGGDGIDAVVEEENGRSGLALDDIRIGLGVSEGAVEGVGSAEGERGAAELDVDDAVTVDLADLLLLEGVVHPPVDILVVDGLGLGAENGGDEVRGRSNESRHVRCRAAISPIGDITEGFLDTGKGIPNAGNSSGNGGSQNLEATDGTVAQSTEEGGQILAVNNRALAIGGDEALGLLVHSLHKVPDTGADVLRGGIRLLVKWAAILGVEAALQELLIHQVGILGTSNPALFSMSAYKFN